jgi:hypothetical protein
LPMYKEMCVFMFPEEEHYWGILCEWVANLLYHLYFFMIKLLIYVNNYSNVSNSDKTKIVNKMST